MIICIYFINSVLPIVTDAVTERCVVLVYCAILLISSEFTKGGVTAPQWHSDSPITVPEVGVNLVPHC